MKYGISMAPSIIISKEASLPAARLTHIIPPYGDIILIVELNRDLGKYGIVIRPGLRTDLLDIKMCLFLLGMRLSVWTLILN